MSRNRITSVADRFAKDDQYFEMDRKELIEMLPSSIQRLLDIGCGAGASWESFAGEVHGIEYDAESAELARERLASVYSGDIQKIELPYDKGSFDCIVFADVLEHLYDPWGTLLRLRPFLAEDGYVLISVPNIRYYKVVKSLVFRADFSYERSGVMDIDHVRFFARKNVEWMLEQTGFRIQQWRFVRRGSSKYRFLNRVLFNRLDDFLTKQFYVLAQIDPSWQGSSKNDPGAAGAKAAVTS